MWGGENGVLGRNVTLNLEPQEQIKSIETRYGREIQPGWDI